MYNITLIVIIALLSNFVVLFISKIGLRDKIIMKAKVKKISEMFDCDFCLSFWTNVVICLVCSIVMSDISIMLIPFIAAPITRFLI